MEKATIPSPRLPRTTRKPNKTHTLTIALVSLTQQALLGILYHHFLPLSPDAPLVTNLTHAFAILSGSTASLLGLVGAVTNSPSLLQTFALFLRLDALLATSLRLLLLWALTQKAPDFCLLALDEKRASASVSGSVGGLWLEYRGCRGSAWMAGSVVGGLVCAVGVLEWVGGERIARVVGVLEDWEEGGDEEEVVWGFESRDGKGAGLDG